MNTVKPKRNDTDPKGVSTMLFVLLCVVTFIACGLFANENHKNRNLKKNPPSENCPPCARRKRANYLRPSEARVPEIDYSKRGEICLTKDDFGELMEWTGRVKNQIKMDEQLLDLYEN